jgi:heat-inducible transcriptional repressor
LVRRELEGRLANMRRELMEDIEWVAQLIAETTSEAGVAVRPMDDGPTLEAVSLVPLENRRVLCVVVTNDGRVEKRVLELERNSTREQLQTISNYLTTALAGESIADIESELGGPPETGGGETPSQWTDAWEIAQLLFAKDDHGVEVKVAGTDNLLATSDFTEIERVRSLISTLEDRARIAKEFRRAFALGSTQVLIGDESEATASGNLGIVASLYFRDNRRAGAVGVVGPRRMDYQRIVPLVEYVGNTLTRMLEATGEASGAKHA